MATINNFVLKNKHSLITFDKFQDYIEAQEHITIESFEMKSDTIIVYPYFACKDYADIEEFANDCNCNLAAIHYT